MNGRPNIVLVHGRLGGWILLEWGHRTVAGGRLRRTGPSFP
jgi:hypothetical protein